MRSNHLTRLRAPLLGLGTLLLAGATALAADGSSKAAYQSAALGQGDAMVAADALPGGRPETFVIDSSRDTAAMFGVMAAILDLQPAQISVTELGADSDLQRASAVRDWLAAQGIEEGRITIAGRDVANAGAEARDGAVQITLIE